MDVKKDMDVKPRVNLEEKAEEMHNHTFFWKYGNSPETTMLCKQAGTIYESLERSDKFKEISSSVKDKELVILTPNQAISSHFPCHVIADLDITNLTIKYIPAVDNQTPPKSSNNQNQNHGELVTFVIKTTGGQGITIKVMKNDHLRKEVAEVIVYGYKGQTVKEALEQDGRFSDTVFDEVCELQNTNPSDDSCTEMSCDVEILHDKCFMIKRCKIKGKRRDRKGAKHDAPQEATASKTASSKSPPQGETTSKLLTPKTSKPPTPDTSKPPTPDTSKPPTPDTSKLLTPKMSKLLTPKTSKPPTPDMSKPPTPDMSKPPTPDMSKLLTPKMSKLLTPKTSKLLTPKMSKLLTPKMRYRPIPGSEDVASLLRSQFEVLVKIMKARQRIASQAEQPLFLEEYGKNSETCHEVSTTRKLLKMGDSVCLVTTDRVAAGTGFLLFGNYILTNAHVVLDGSQTTVRENLEVIFFYENIGAVQFMSVKVVAYGVKSDGADCMFDWALLEICAGQNTKRKVQPLLNNCGLVNDEGAICIIGHPGGQVKKIDPCCTIPYNDRVSKYQLCLRSYFQQLDGNLHIYESCFYNGSSGSPVIDKDFKVVSMHSGGFKNEDEKSVVEYAQPLSLILEQIIIKLVTTGKTNMLLEIKCDIPKVVMENLKNKVEMNQDERLVYFLKLCPDDGDQPMETS